MKRITTIGTAIIIALTIIFFVIAQQSEYTYNITQSELPYLAQETITLTAEPNTSLDITYQEWLSGTNNIYMNNTNTTALIINISVPEDTAEGNYTKIVEITSQNSTPSPENITFYFNIINDTVNYTNNITNNDTNNTQENHTFSIETDKDNYEYGETPMITLIATNQSNITLNYSRLCKTCDTTTYEFLSTQTISNTTTPIEQDALYNNVSGHYLIQAKMQYENTTLTDTAKYFIDNNITITITGDTTIKEEENIYLEATAEGGESPYKYSWNLSNDTIIENSTLNMTFDDSGTYTQILTVTDANNDTKNKSVTITVKNTYAITLKIKDSVTGNVISGALVELEDNDAALTNSNGEARFHPTSGRKDVTINKEYYEEYEGEVDIDQDETFTIGLKKVEGTDGGTAPKINLVSPTNNERITGTTANFVFRVTDDRSNNCSLYLSDTGKDNPTVRATKEIPGGSEYSFTQANLAYGSYKWKIRCISTDDKSAYSDERIVILTSPESTPTPKVEILTEETNPPVEEPEEELILTGGEDGNNTNSTNSITGNTVFDFSLTNPKNVIIMVVVAFAIVGLYCAFLFKWTDKTKVTQFFADNNQLHHVRRNIRDAEDHLEMGNHRKAQNLYQQIRETYGNLNASNKRAVYGEITPLFNKLDLTYLKQMIRNMNVLIGNNELEKAQAEYAKLQGTYNKIDLKFKEEFYPQIEHIMEALGKQNS